MSLFIWQGVCEDKENARQSVLKAQHTSQKKTKSQRENKNIQIQLEFQGSDLNINKYLIFWIQFHPIILSIPLPASWRPLWQHVGGGGGGGGGALHGGGGRVLGLEREAEEAGSETEGGGSPGRKVGRR